MTVTEAPRWRFVQHPKTLVWTPRHVLECAAEAFGVDENDLLGPYRHQPLAGYRMVSYAAVKRFCNLSFTATARVFHRHHTTIMYGIDQVDSDVHLADLYSALAERLLLEGIA